MRRPRRSRQLLRDRVTSDAPELADRLPLLATPLQLDVPDTPETAALERRFRKRRVEETSAAFVAALLHDADPHRDRGRALDGRGIDRHPASRRTGIADGPWLVCLTRNDDEAGFHASGPELAGAQARAAVRCRRDGARATRDRGATPSPARRRAADQPGGRQPAIPHGARSGGRGRGRGERAPGLHRLARVGPDRPAPRRRRAATSAIAAVLGHAFDEPLLAAVVDADGGSPAPRLDGLLVADGPGRLRFRYALLRDVAYEGLAYGRGASCTSEWPRCSRHRSDDPKSMPRSCPSTSSTAIGTPTAWRYARVAANRARADYANVEAAELLERALASARRVADIDLVEVAVVAEELGDVREQIGVYDRARDAYRTARRMRADDPVYDAQLCLKEAWIAERLGRYSQAIRWLRRGLRRLDELADAGSRGDACAARRVVRRRAPGTRPPSRGHQVVRDGDRARSFRRRPRRARARGVPSRLGVHRSRSARPRHQLGRVALALRAARQPRRPGRGRQQPRATRVLRRPLGRGARAARACPGRVAADRRRRRGRARECELCRDPPRARPLRRGRSPSPRRAPRVSGGGIPGRPRPDDRVPRSGRGTNQSHGRRRWRCSRRHAPASSRSRAGSRCVRSRRSSPRRWCWRAMRTRALQLLEGTIAAARAGGEIGLLGPPLYRCLGYARAQIGDLVEARAALDESLALGREQAQSYEVGLTLVALSRLGGDERDTAAAGSTKPPRSSPGSVSKPCPTSPVLRRSFSTRCRTSTRRHSTPRATERLIVRFHPG